MRSEKQPPSLRMLVLMMIGILLTVFIVVFFTVIQSTMTNLLRRSEESYFQKQARGVMDLLNLSMLGACHTAYDAAIGEELAGYAAAGDADSIRSDWSDASLPETYDFTFLVVKDRAGGDLHAEFYSRGEQEPPPDLGAFSDELNNLSADVLALHGPGTARPESAEGYGRYGLLFLDDRPYFLACMPVMDSAESQNPVGTLTLGRLLDDEFFDRYGHYETTRFRIRPLEGTVPPRGTEVVQESWDVIRTTLPLTDMEGGFALLEMLDDRAIYNDGRKVISTGLMLLLAAVVVLVAATYLLVSRLVLRPVERLSGDIGDIGPGSRVDAEKYTRSAEFLGLCGAINAMLAGLEKSQISLEVFQEIVGDLDAYIYITDPETDEVLFIDNKMAKMYGLEGKDYSGRPCWEVLETGFDKRCDFCPLDKLMEDPDLIYAWEHKSVVTGRYYQNSDWMVRWTDGRRVHLQQGIEITESKLAEAALQKRLDQQELMSAISQSFISTEELPVLVENALEMVGKFMGASKIVIAVVDGDNAINLKYGWVNREQGVRELVARGAMTLAPGNVIYDAFVEKRMPYITCTDAAAWPEFNYLARFGVKSFIIVPISVAGKFWGMITVDDCLENRKWHDSDIHLVRLIGSVISELFIRSETEEELMRMSSIVDSSPLCIVYMGAEGRLEYVNQGAAEITGYSREELLERGMYSLFDSGAERTIREEILPAYRAGEGQTYELPLTRKDGETRDMLISAFATGRQGDGIGVIATDITEKRRLERELMAAKEQAEQSNQAKSEFLSRMSHEMRTPMNAIIGMTSIAKSTGDPERKDYCLGKIDAASVHLLGVINDILDMSKIESGKFELSYTDFSFERLLMRVTNVVNFRVDEKEQNLLIKMDADLPPAIVSDEQRLAQVITNLLSNAVKFTPEGGTITVRAGLVEEDADGLCTLQIAVTDTGIGISEEQQGRLFQSFEQADGSISRKFGGTGLGLVISKSIVELMGGRIWIESELGKGSSFLFQIKAQRGINAPDNALLGDMGWQNLKVLAVDDSPDVRDYFLSLSSTLGLQFDVAAGGAEAVKRMDGEAYHIVFVDWRMPGMDGMELTRKIKELYGESTVVIMISAAEWSNLEEEAKEAGVDRFIPKPLFASAIADCINECLGSPRERMAENAGAQELAGIFAGNRILLAEDVAINREILIALLEPTGIAIDCAEDGRAAYDMFRENPGVYDMIFMDIHMPEVDGYESTRLIRELDIPWARDIPIVAMTANVFREDVDKCLAAGMNAHVGKPLDMADVVSKLRQYLRR